MTPPHLTDLGPYSQVSLPPPIRRYFKHLSEVPGWFAPVDFLAFLALSEFQMAQGVGGDLLEIGVYAGKSAILLGHLRSEDETLVVCDVFTGTAPEMDQAENAKWYPRGVPQRLFESWYLRHHDSLPRVIAGPSLALRETSFDRPFRIVHIDGSHVYSTVRADLETARNLSCPQGIVILDDFGRPHAPGVGCAAWEAAFEGHLRPFLITNCKLYAHWGGFGDELSGFLAAWAPRAGLLADPYEVASGEVLFVHEPPTLVGTFQRAAHALLPPAVWGARRRVRRWRRRTPGSPRRDVFRP